MDDFSIEDRQFVLSLSALSTSIDSRLSNFRRDEQTRLLGKVSKLLIQSTSESKDIYEQILYLLVNHPETAFKGAILRVKQEDNSFQLVAKSFFEGVIGARDDRDRKPDEKSFLSLVIAEKQRLILQDVQLLIQDDNTQSNPNPFKNEQWIRDNKFQSFACFPLIAEGDEVQGTLSLYTGYNYEFHPDSVEIFSKELPID